jgi:hypothetical protein
MPVLAAATVPEIDTVDAVPPDGVRISESVKVPVVVVTIDTCMLQLDLAANGVAQLLVALKWPLLGGV